MQDRRLRELRRQLAGTKRGRGLRYDGALKARMIAWAAEAVSRGTAVAAAAAMLGVHARTLTAWLRSAPPTTGALVPVEVVATRAPTALLAPATITLIAPTGWRLEGLTLDDALRAIARLG